MKKIVLILSIALLSATASFAQAWTVKVTWDASSSNCDCETSIGSKYVISFQVVDNANGNQIVCANSVFVNPTLSEYTFDAQCVKDYCNDTSIVNAPNYTIYAYVGFWCAETNPPLLICDGTNSVSNVSCLDFSLATVEVPLITLQ